jgi:hypothetical protein
VERFTILRVILALLVGGSSLSIGTNGTIGTAEQNRNKLKQNLKQIGTKSEQPLSLAARRPKNPIFCEIQIFFFVLTPRFRHQK